MSYFDAVKIENISLEIIKNAPPYIVSAALNADEENYYNFQKTITEKYTCVIHAESGYLRFITEDASTIAPHAGERVFGIDEITPDGVTLDGTWKFDEETRSFYQDVELVAANTLSTNTMRRDKLMQSVFRKIDIIQNSALLKKSRDTDAADLTALRQYADELRDVDLMSTDTWPAPPQGMN